jgi:hypothetical protein
LAGRLGFEPRELVDVDGLALPCAIAVPRRSGLAQQHAHLHRQQRHASVSPFPVFWPTNTGANPGISPDLAVYSTITMALVGCSVRQKWRVYASSQQWSRAAIVVPRAPPLRQSDSRARLFGRPVKRRQPATRRRPTDHQPPRTSLVPR